jgi:hypothetical protein
MTDNSRVHIKGQFIVVDDNTGKAIFKNVYAINTYCTGNGGLWKTEIYAGKKRDSINFTCNSKKEAELMADEICDACIELDNLNFGRVRVDD